MDARRGERQVVHARWKELGGGTAAYIKRSRAHRAGCGSTCTTTADRTSCCSTSCGKALIAHRQSADHRGGCTRLALFVPLCGLRNAFRRSSKKLAASTKFKAMLHAVDASAATNTLIEQIELTTDGTRNVDFADSQSAMVCGNLSGGNLRERQFGSDSEFQCQVVVDG